MMVIDPEKVYDFNVRQCWWYRCCRCSVPAALGACWNISQEHSTETTLKFRRRVMGLAPLHYGISSLLSLVLSRIVSCAILRAGHQSY